MCACLMTLESSTSHCLHTKVEQTLFQLTDMNILYAACIHMNVCQETGSIIMSCAFNFLSLCVEELAEKWILKRVD